MTFEEFWQRQQYTDDADDKDFARETWELSADLEREQCAVIADEYATSAVLENPAQATAEAIAKTIRMRSNVQSDRRSATTDATKGEEG